MTTTRAAAIRRVSVLSLILFLGVACGPRTYPIGKWTFLSSYKVDVSAAGTEASITVREGAADRTVTGELIEVRGDGFLVLSDEMSELTLVPYDRMSRIDFGDDVGASRSVGSATGPWFARIPPLREDAERQRAMARFSRYPFGLDEAQFQRLLEALGQSELVVIGS